jgi:hypothetical protein
MTVTPSSDRWVVCASCGEIVQQSADPQVQRQFHAPACTDQARPRLMQPRPGPAGHPPVTTDPGDGAKRAARPAAVLSSARSPAGRIVLSVLAGASVIAAAAFLVSSHPAASADPPAASRTRAVPAPPVPSRPGFRSTMGITPAPSSPGQPSVAIPPLSPVPSQTQPAGLVVDDFTNGPDGFHPMWGNISDTTSASPSFDGDPSLLLTTSSDTYTAVGTPADVAQLATGDTVTFHVWSGGGTAASVRPFVQDDGFTVHFAGPADTVLPSRAGWLTLAWTVPATSSVLAVGLQVINPGGGTVTLALGGLSWPRG